MNFIHGLLYFLPLFTFIAVVYALYRNQRSAKDSNLVDTSNFLPRLRAIIEVLLHPDHAALWIREATPEEASAIANGSYRFWNWHTSEPLGDGSFTDLYFVRVFPTLGMDSSEIGGIRLDDGE